MVSLNKTTIRPIQIGFLTLIAIGLVAFIWLVFGGRKPVPGEVRLKHRRKLVVADYKPITNIKRIAARTFQGQPLAPPKKDSQKTKPKAIIKKPSSELFVEGILHDANQPEQALVILNQGGSWIAINSPLPGKWSGWKIKSIHSNETVEVVSEGIKDQLKRKDQP